MNYKYIILDFGKVISGPTTGNWFMTPKFLELIDTNIISEEKFNNAVMNYNEVLSEKLITQEEEFDMFTRFYYGILNDLKYPNTEIAKEIAYDMTYNFTKYTLYKNIKEELDKLKENYKLILLTDNWPCVTNYLKHYNLYDYFDKVYISSVYGVQKSEGVFFDYPINEYSIKPGEALFIDDNEINLDQAKEKGLDVLLMDREKTLTKSKYKIINNLMEII